MSPHLYLHVLTWGSAARTSLRRVQVSQNKILRNIIPGRSTEEMFALSGVPNVDNIYAYKLGVFMFIQLHANDIFSVIFQNLKWNHNYSTRGVNLFRRPFSRVAFNQRFWVTRGLQLWDSLPRSIQECDSIGQFKASIVGF